MSEIARHCFLHAAKNEDASHISDDGEIDEDDDDNNDDDISSSTSDKSSCSSQSSVGDADGGGEFS